MKNKDNILSYLNTAKMKLTKLNSLIKLKLKLRNLQLNTMEFA